MAWRGGGIRSAGAVDTWSSSSGSPGRPGATGARVGVTVPLAVCGGKGRWVASVTGVTCYRRALASSRGGATDDQLAADACRLPHRRARRRRSRRAPGTSSWPRGSTRPPRPGSLEPNAMVLATAVRRRHAQLADGAVQGRRRARGRCSTRTTPRRRATTCARLRRVGDLPLVLTAPAGERARARSSGSRRGDARRTGRPARAAPSWARGRRRSRPWCATGEALEDALTAIDPAFRRRGRAAAAALGRLADRARAGRVLAGPRRPDARPAALRAERRRPDVAVRRLAP